MEDYLFIARIYIYKPNHLAFSTALGVTLGLFQLQQYVVINPPEFISIYVGFVYYTCY